MMKKVLNKKGETHIVAIVLAVVIFGGLMLGIGGMLSKSSSSAANKSTSATMTGASSQVDENRKLNADQTGENKF